MVKKCYLLNNDDATITAVSRIINRIPCFIDAKAVSSNRFELYIQCRAEDICSVERVLAPYV